MNSIIYLVFILLWRKIMNLYTLRSAVVLSLFVLSLLISNTSVFAMGDSDPDSSKSVTKQAPFSAAAAAAAKALETLDNESRDPRSLVSVLPRDIVNLTREYLNPCPVLTINSKILDKVLMYGCNNLNSDSKKKFSNHTDTFMDAYVKIQKNTTSYIFQYNGVDYVYSSGFPGVCLGKDESLKDVLVKDGPAFVLRGVLVDSISAQPSHTGNTVLYTGAKAGQYCFSFTLHFRGDSATPNRYFDMHSGQAERLTD